MHGINIKIRTVLTYRAVVPIYGINNLKPSRHYIHLAPNWAVKICWSHLFYLLPRRFMHDFSFWS